MMIIKIAEVSFKHGTSKEGAVLGLCTSRPRLCMADMLGASRVAFEANDPQVMERVERYRSALAHYEAGTMDGAHFRMARIQAGVHLQRAPSTRYMVRIKVPYGLLTAAQLHTVAAGTRWTAADLHLTTRQAVEFHDVRLDDTVVLLADMAAAGLPGWEAGGNSLRNVTSCPLVGTCPWEPFDPVPTIRQIVRDFATDPALEQLPRKVKVGFAGCARDCAGICLQDLGCLARLRNGEAGFAVFVGGGIGAAPRVGECLAGFVPARALSDFLRAVLWAFDRLGNRQNRHRGRLKWLVGEMGLAAFRDVVEQKYESLGGSPVDWERPDAVVPPPPLPAAPPDVLGADWAQGQHMCHREHDGRWAVTIAWPGGAVPPRGLMAIADWAQRWGNGLLSITTRQDIIMHGIARPGLPQVFAHIRAERPQPGIPSPQIVSCPGSPYCNLALTRSGAVTQALARALEEDTRVHPSPGLADLTIRVAGCPHSCSHARFAAVGLIGGGARLGHRMIPVYTLFLGGVEGGLSPRVAVPTVRIPARQVPAAVLRLVNEFRTTAAVHESFSAWAIRRGMVPMTNRGVVKGDEVD